MCDTITLTILRTSGSPTRAGNFLHREEAARDSAFPLVLFRICIFFLTNWVLMIIRQLTETFKEPVKFSRQVDGSKGSCQVSEEQVTMLPTEKQGRICQWIMQAGVLYESGLICSFVTKECVWQCVCVCVCQCGGFWKPQKLHFLSCFMLSERLNKLLTKLENALWSF